MNRITYTYILSILIFVGVNIYSQELFTLDKSLNLNESVKIFTDRDIYLTEEIVNFKIFNLSPSELKKCNWSKIIYLELITPDGVAIMQNKYAFDSLGSSGEFKIPEGIFTGNYYLRAYTRWMRNYSQYEYAYKLISLVNPKSSEKLIGNQGAYNKNIYTQFDDTTSEQIRVVTNKSVYSRKDTVIVSFKFGINESANIAISVSRKDALCFKNVDWSKGVSHNAGKFIPEIRGVSLSGQIINEKDSLPLRNQLVSLTLFGKTPDNFGTVTDKFGRFYFAFNSLKGNKEIFISSASKNNINTAIILVENDFCSKQVKLPYIPLSSSTKSLQLLNEFYFYSQLNQQYQSKEVEINESVSIDSVSEQTFFYGKPSYVLNLKEYVLLPTLEDYFHELMPSVKVRQVGKEKSISVLGTAQDLNVYDPLIMVDLVAISDINSILALSPEKIKRIEVVDKPYVKGNIVYGGLINILSELNDFANVNFNSTGRFFKYKFLSTEMSEFQKSEGSIEKGTPDLRNTLFWRSFSISELSKKGEIKFTSGDVPGEYVVIIRGYTEDGTLINSITSFQVE